MKIHNAIIFATQAHEGQFRKGTKIPYIIHPMEVMQILTENGCDETVIVAGILHDTLEDTPTTPDDLLRNFGQEVLELVQNESEDKSKTWQERKQTTIDYLTTASKEVQMICCADKLSNIMGIYADKLVVGDSVFNRFNAPKEKTQWYYQSIVRALDKVDGYKMKQELVKYVNAVFGDNNNHDRPL